MILTGNDCRKFKAAGVPFSPYLYYLGANILLSRLAIKKNLQVIELKNTTNKTTKTNNDTENNNEIDTKHATK